MLGLLLLVGTGCRTDVDLAVTVEDDGSGLVRATTVLDSEASARLLDLQRDSDGLLLTDLVLSGWDVSPPEEGADGSTVITASKAFGSASQFSEVMDELTGEAGAVRNFVLVRTKSFARVDYEVIGTIDTTGGLDAFGDADLETALGRSLSDIASRYGATADDLGFDLTISLPGNGSGETTTGVVTSEDGRLVARWPADFADPDVIPVTLGSSTREVSALVLRGLAVTAGVLAAIIVFAQFLRVLLPDRRRRAQRRRRAAQRVRNQAQPPPEAPRNVTQELPALVIHKVVALDGMGVLYREADDVRRLLIPFARDRGATATDDDIVARTRALSLGRITTGELWRTIGVEGDPDELDAAYLALHQLSPGVVKYLRMLRDRGVRVACITNDAAGWAARLRTRHNLERLIDPWVVSGSVGVRKPDKPMFEVLRRVTGEDPRRILVVDDDLDVLDVARDLGFATSWFSPGGSHADARGHSIIRSFDVPDDELVEVDHAKP